MGYDYEANKAKLHSSSGQRLTTQLFEELARDDVAAKPVFKLSDWRKVYVEIADPTGYDACEALLGNWEHWLLLCKAPGFAEALKEWNEEVAVKLQSEAMKNLRKQAKLPTGTAAAKVLAGLGETTKRKPKVEPEGADREAKQRARDDAKRLGLSVVK